ncbi:MAG: hypothetical protein ACWA5W_08775 [Phycisphaerales bacterium]
MTQHFFSIFPLIAQAKSAADNALDPEAYRRASSLTLMVALLGVILITVLALIVVIRRSHRRKEQLAKSGPTIHTDAWTESGKRFDGSIIEINPDDDDDEPI